MRKKVTVFIFAILFCSSFLFAQHVSWSKLPHAFRYEIEVECMSETTGQWEEYDTYRTSDTYYDFELPAGSYRFRITARNIIGIRGETSDWALFDVLETTQPFLSRDMLPVHKTYGVPVLSRSIPSENGTEKLSVKCYNCFFDDTRFSLVPVNDGSGFSSRFASLYERTAIPLTVADKDSEHGTVTLNIDWSKIQSGCYELYVENSTGEHDSFAFLALPRKTPSFNAETLPFDTNYNVNVLDVVSGTSVHLDLPAYNIQFDTAARLVPAAVPANPYPFISSQPGSEQKVTLSCSNGNASLSFNTTGLTTGYYSLVAETPDAGKTEIPLLVKMTYPEEDMPQIVTISGKFNRKNQTLELSVENDTESFFSSTADSARLVLVSESDVYGENKRIPLRMTEVDKSGKTAVFETAATSVEAGTYGLMLETEGTVRQAFVEITENLAVKEVELSDELIETQFLQPATEEAVAAKTEEAAAAAALGYRYPEAIPSMTMAGRAKTDWLLNSGFVARSSTELISDKFVMSAINTVSNVPYTAEFRLVNAESLNLLRQSEGISFQSMVTDRNNAGTKWKFVVVTTEGNVEQSLVSQLNTLSQTVIIWKDKGIDPEKIQSVYFVADARYAREAGFKNTLEVYEAKTYSSIDPVPVLSFKQPVLFSTVGARVGFAVGASDSSEALNRLTSGVGMNPSFVRANKQGGSPSFGILDSSEVFVRLVDYGWISLDLSWYPFGIGNTGPMFGYGVRLAVPNKWVEPYVGLSPVKGLDGFEAFPWYAGVTLFKYVDLRYTCYWEWIPINSSNHLQLMDTYLSVGIEVPIRKEKVKLTKPFSPLIETETKTPVFCTDLLLLPSISWSDCESGGPGYMHRLPDFGIGVRAVDFRFFEVDAAFTVRNIMDARDRYEFDVRGNWALKLPVRMFGTDVLTPSYGLGVGYRFNHEGYINQQLGLKIGKYINLSINGNISLSQLNHVSDLINMAPILAPITAFSASDWWDVSCGITIPLRTPVTREKSKKEGI